MRVGGGAVTPRPLFSEAMDRTKTTYEWAQHYAGLGLSVIPVHYIKPDGACSCRLGLQCESPGKHPALRWEKYQKERADAEQLAVWFDGSFHAYNIGIVTGAISGNVGVIDVDIGKGKQGAETIQDLQRDNDDLPPTMEGKTGSGGKHYFYRFPEGIKIRTDKNVLGHGVDTRGEGGFVVAAPSVHVSGGRYEIDDDPIEDAPGWLVDLCNDDTARELQLGIHGMQKQNGAGMFGEITDGREGYMVRVILGVIRSYVEEHHALPPLDKVIAEGFPVYERKVSSRGKSLEADGRGISLFTRRAAYQLERAKRGELRVIKDIPLDGNPPPGSHLSVIPGGVQQVDAETGEIIQLQPKIEQQQTKKLVIREWGIENYQGEAPEVHWLVENIIPAGVPMLLAAIGGLGKSFIALDMAIKIAAGDDTFHAFTALGGKIKEHGRVVFLTAEDSKDSIHRRLNAIADDEVRERARDKLFVVPLPDAGGAAPFIYEQHGEMKVTPVYLSIRQQLMEIENIKLVIVDPLQAFVHADITSNPAAAQFWWNVVGELCATTGATVMVTHHMRKEGSFSITKAMQAREAIRGTTALVDGARLVYGLWNMPEEEEADVLRALELPVEANSVVCGAIVKVNDMADTSIKTFVREESGLLVDRTNEVEAVFDRSGKLNTLQIKTILDAIQRRWDEGKPFSANPQSSTRYVVPWLCNQYSLQRRHAKAFVMEQIEIGKLVEEQFDNKSKMRGLRLKT